MNIIHGLPLLPLVEWTFIYLPILYHTFYGFWIIATGQPNVDRYRYGKNWFYLMQRISAIVLVFFMIFHILGMKGVFGAETHDALKFDTRQRDRQHCPAFQFRYLGLGVCLPLWNSRIVLSPGQRILGPRPSPGV